MCLQFWCNTNLSPFSKEKKQIQKKRECEKRSKEYGFGKGEKLDALKADKLPKVYNIHYGGFKNCLFFTLGNILLESDSEYRTLARAL